METGRECKLITAQNSGTLAIDVDRQRYSGYQRHLQLQKHLSEIIREEKLNIGADSLDVK